MACALHLNLRHNFSALWTCRNRCANLCPTNETKPSAGLTTTAVRDMKMAPHRKLGCSLPIFVRMCIFLMAKVLVQCCRVCGYDFSVIGEIACTQVLWALLGQISIHIGELFCRAVTTDVFQISIRCG